jgi:hypothetical protein
MVTYPDLGPGAEGEKVTLIVQLELAVRALGQLFVSTKSPVAFIFTISRVTLPILVTVIGCDALVVKTVCAPNVRLLAETLMPVIAVPVPVSVTVCGLPVALSEMLTFPIRVPGALGVKVTPIVQFPPAGIEVPHVFVCPKS